MELRAIDEAMADWRKKFYGQHNARNTNKIARNIDDVRHLIKGHRSVLDVGCNIGTLYEEFRPEKYLGIDLDPKVIDEAQTRFPGVDFRVGDLYELEGHWDLVIASRVLMHIAPLDEAMRRLLGAANEYLVLFVPLAQEDCFEDHGHSLNGETVHSYFRRFSQETLKSFGDCNIVGREPYSTVIYGPRVP